MKRLAALVLLATLLAITSGIERAAPPADTLPLDAHVSFAAVQVFIDPHGKSLACYQVRVVATEGDATLVGIEGGESAAFNSPPYYDPRALQGDRIILGGYSLGGDLPAGKTRVATLMFRVPGNIEPRYDARVEVAGTTDATPIEATVSLVPIVPPQTSTKPGESR